MYNVEKLTIQDLVDITNNHICNTVFQSAPWLKFLEKNQQGEIVCLKLLDDNRLILGYFVGLIIKKTGIKILGSPFEGWLTCDMGFIRTSDDFDNIEALETVKKYAFRNLKCLFVQITDKQISIDDLPKAYHVNKSNLLYIDNSRELDEILDSFTKNGRRDVRASQRKGLEIKRVPFDKAFADTYYNQLIDVFAKQSLKPFYNVNKIYDMVDAFKEYPDAVLALEAVLPTDESDKIVATVLSLGFGSWAYYLGAASYRDYQKYLPNEALMWEMIKFWNEKGIKNIDLVGYREYKMKYNPELRQCPTIYFEKIPGLNFMKNTARNCVEIIRKFK